MWNYFIVSMRSDPAATTKILWCDRSVFVNRSIHIARAGDSKVPHFEEVVLWQGFKLCLSQRYRNKKLTSTKNFCCVRSSYCSPLHITASSQDDLWFLPVMLTVTQLVVILLSQVWMLLHTWSAFQHRVHYLRRWAKAAASQTDQEIFNAAIHFPIAQTG